MSRWTIFSLLCLSLVMGGAVAQTDMVSIRDTGAVGDGETDDTDAIIAAVQQARDTDQNVYVPKGEYRISRAIELDKVTLTGPVATAWPADANVLPSFRPVHSDGPAFHLLEGGGLSWVDITYPTDREIREGDLAVLVSGIGTYVSNARIRYAWDGILADGDHNVGRSNFENIFMVSIRNIGVRITGTWDVPRLHNIEVWNAGPVPRGLEEGIGFHLGMNDLIRMTDCFVFAMQYGFLFEDEIEGLEIDGPTWGVMNGCSTDFCGIGVEVRGDHTVSISGGSFWNHHQSLVVDGEGARVRMSGSELKSNGAPAVLVRNSDHVVITGNSLLRDMEEHRGPAVVLEGGRTVLGSNHIKSYGVGVQIQPEVKAAQIHGNSIDSHGHPAIENDAEVDAAVQIEGNLTVPSLPAPPPEQEQVAQQMP